MISEGADKNEQLGVSYVVDKALKETAFEGQKSQSKQTDMGMPKKLRAQSQSEEKNETQSNTESRESQLKLLSEEQYEEFWKQKAKIKSLNKNATGYVRLIQTLVALLVFYYLDVNKESTGELVQQGSFNLD